MIKKKSNHLVPVREAENENDGFDSLYYRKLMYYIC